VEKKSETSSTWVSELEKSEAELGPQENEEVPVVRLWPEPLREEGQQKPPSDQQSTIVASAIREAIRELREEQSIHFETESDEKFAVGYLYKTIMIALRAESSERGPQQKTKEVPPPSVTRKPVRVGDRLRHPASDRMGTVIKIEGNSMLVQWDGLDKPTIAWRVPGESESEGGGKG